MVANTEKPIPRQIWVGLSTVLSLTLLTPLFFLSFHFLNADALVDTYSTLATIALVVLVASLLLLLLTEVAVVRRTWLQLLLVTFAMFVAVVATTELGVLFSFAGIFIVPCGFITLLLFGIYLVGTRGARWLRLTELLSFLIIATLLALSIVAYEQFVLSTYKLIASVNIEGRYFHLIRVSGLSDSNTVLLECNNIGIACQSRYALGIYSKDIRLETEEGTTPSVTLLADGEPVYRETLK